MTFSSIQPFARNRLTWLAYAMLAYIGFTQSMLGPLMPFLRSELQLNYTLGGFLPAALAVGLILSGLCGDWLADRVNLQSADGIVIVLMFAACIIVMNNHWLSESI